jgi:agmatinase
MKKYKPIDSLKSPRFCGIRTFMRLPHVSTAEEADFAVVGIPFDTGVTFRAGARFAPEAIRSNSVILKPYNIALGIDIFNYCSGYDYGDLPIVPGFIEDSYEMIEKGLLQLLDQGIIPVSLGGDHSITLAELRAVAKKHGPVALIQFDSHTDTMDSYFGRRYNHGTPFRRAVEEGLIDPGHSIQVGIRGSVYSKDDLNSSKELGLEMVTAVEIQQIGIPAIIQKIHERVKTAKVFVTFDIDFVDAAYAPGTGTPEVGGFTSVEALQAVRGLKGLNLIGFDLVEVLPAHDPNHITAFLASSVAYEFISLIALRKQMKARGQ